MKIIRLASLLALLLGFGLRLLLVSQKQALEYDDAISLLAATGHEGEYARIAAQGEPPIGVWTTAGEWQRLVEPQAGRGLSLVAKDLATYDLHPPLYFWLLQGWLALFGASLPAVNTLNLAIDLFTGLLLLGAGSRLFGDPAAGTLLAATWMVSPIAVKASFWVRQYSLLAFFSFLFAYLLYRLLFEPPASPARRNLLRLALILAGIAGLLVHYYFVLVLASGFLLMAWVYLRSRRERSRLWGAVAILAAIAVLFVLVDSGLRSTLATYVESRLATRFSGFYLIDRLRTAGKTLLILFSPALLALSLRFAARWRLSPAGDPHTQLTSEETEDHNPPSGLLPWALAFSLLPTLAMLVLYLGAITQAHTFSSRYLGFASPFFASLAVLLVLRPPLRPGWALAFLAGIAALGALTLNPALAESQVGNIDVASLQAAPVVVVDSIAWGTWPSVVQQMDASQLVFIDSQDALAANPGAWLDKLGSGGMYVSYIRGSENTEEKRSRILDMIKERYPISLDSVLYRPDSWALVLFRVGN